MAAAAGGEAAAFEALYFRYRDWVMGVAFRFAGEREGALDAVQETFAYLHRKLPGLRLSGRLTTLLYPAAKHAALAARGKRRLAQGGAERGAEPAVWGDIPGAHAELHAAVSTLPEAQREALLMRYVSGMSVREIALALGVAEGTIKSRLHHAVAGVSAFVRAAEGAGSPAAAAEGGEGPRGAVR